MKRAVSIIDKWKREGPSDKWKRDSPLDRNQWPESITAHVVEPGATPRIFGYDLQDDLAENYSLPELFLLLLTGSLPTAKQGKGFELVLSWLLPVDVAQGPVHAAGLARLCGASSAGILSVATLGLSEQACAEQDALADLLEWLNEPEGKPPFQYTDRNAEEVEAIEKLLKHLSRIPFTPIEKVDALNLKGTLISVLFQCGLKRPEQIEAAMVIARLPCAFAEAMAVTPGDLNSYPVNLPPVEYQE